MNNELYQLASKLAAENGISLNALIRLLLISAIQGKFNIEILRKHIDVKAENVDIKLAQTDEKKRKKEQAKAERLIVKANEIINKFYNLEEKRQKDYHRLDSYSKISHRLLLLKGKAEELLIEIEKTLDKTSTPEVIDQLTEYHQALLKILKTKI